MFEPAPQTVAAPTVPFNAEADLLRRAKALIVDETNWVQRDSRTLDKAGYVKQQCAIAAIGSVSVITKPWGSDPVAISATRFLAAASKRMYPDKSPLRAGIHNRVIWHNDAHDHAATMQMFDLAIQLAENAYV